MAAEYLERRLKSRARTQESLIVLFLAVIAARTFGATLAFWDFNSIPSDADATTGTLQPVTGSGAASLVGAVTGSFTASNGSSDPNTTDNSNWRITTWPAQGTQNKQNGIQVNKASQTITFGPLADKTYGDGPFAVGASASSGLPVSFSIPSGPASISGSTVTITGAGIVTVRATQAGNTNYNEASPVDQSFTVTNSLVTVTITNSGSGQIAISFAEIPGRDYMVQRSSNLVD